MTLMLRPHLLRLMAFGSLRVTEAMASFTSSPSVQGGVVESPWLGDPIHLTGLNAIHMLFIP